MCIDKSVTVLNGLSWIVPSYNLEKQVITLYVVTHTFQNMIVTKEKHQRIINNRKE